MPTRKVFDIIPPKEHKETAPLAKPEKPSTRAKLGTGPVLYRNKVSGTGKPVILKIKNKVIFWPALTVLVLVCGALASYLLIEPKAEISFWPKKSPLAVKTQVVIGIDIPGEVKTQECPFSQEFPATGIKSLSVKANGMIRVYNAYSTQAQILIANTRFVSADGKLFRISQKIVIPGAHYEGSKLIPGYLDTKVEAGEAGEEYNIGPSTFSLPALAGTPRYTAFYAQSSGSMTGGLKSQTTQVTDGDLSSAKDSFSATALDSCKKALQSSLSPEDHLVNEEAIKSEIIDINTIAKTGQAVAKFTLNIKVAATALVFKKSDLEGFAKTYIATKVPEGKQLDQNSVALSYLPEDVDLPKGKIVLNVEISAEIYPTIDENSIKTAVTSQRPDEVSVSLKRFPDIDNFQIRLWPFWVNKTPSGVEKITLKLKLD
ncbi:MAG: hypothetical protein AAB577_02415 [Patescibacteria group bacterium]